MMVEFILLSLGTFKCYLLHAILALIYASCWASINSMLVVK